MKGVIFLLALIVLFPSWALGGDLMAPYEYDSALVWHHRIDDILNELLNHVLTFLKPVQGRITSRFGYRKHPLLGLVRHHDGIDIACQIGSEVHAALSGIVVSAGWMGGYGNLIKIHHDGEISESRYGHLSRILVIPGQKVAQGSLIAFSGMTGLTTGPHLHFELFQAGRLVDPERFLKR